TAGEGADRFLPGPREPETREVGGGKSARLQKRVRKAEPPKSRHGSAVSLDEPSGNRVRRREGHLLADDRANAGLDGASLWEAHVPTWLLDNQEAQRPRVACPRS